MAINLSRIPSVPYVGAPYAMPIASCTPIDTMPKTVPITIDWAVYGAVGNGPSLGVTINLLGQQVQTPLDKIRSVYIDNTFSICPIYVTFPDTLYTILAPPGSTVLTPVYTNVPQAIIYAEGFKTGQIPLTTLHFSNVDRQGLFIPFSPEGFTNPVSMEYRGSDAENASTVPAYGNFDIGPADASRIVAVALVLPSDNTVINSITIGGNPATIHQQIQNPGSPCRVAIASLVVAAGTSATVAATLASPVISRAFVYTILNAANNVPLQTAQSFGTPASRTVGLVMPANSAAIWACASGNGFDAGGGWTGVPRDGFLTGPSNYASTAGSWLSVIPENKSASVSLARTLGGCVWA